MAEKLINALKKIEQSQREKIEGMLTVLGILGYSTTYTREKEIVKIDDEKIRELFVSIRKNDRQICISFIIRKDKVDRIFLFIDGYANKYSFEEGIELLMILA